jgi:hypothetical protein
MVKDLVNEKSNPAEKDPNQISYDEKLNPTEKNHEKSKLVEDKSNFVTKVKH